MDVDIHDKIAFYACELARRRNPNLIDDPRKYYPLMARGTFVLDYRQATIFVDIVKQGLSDPRRKVLDAARSSAMMRTTLAQLWTHASERLLERMANTYHVEASIVADARRRVGKAASLDGLGAYSASDHLDILDSSDEFARQEEQYFLTYGKQLGRSKSVDDVMYASLKLRLGNALDPVLGDPFAWQPISEFGEVLHIVSDFFGHTNYVELAFWELALRGHLRPSLVLAFNEIPDTKPGLPTGCLCPLPDRATLEARTRSGTMFCYRESPAMTPLVSSLFVLDDTVQSLLRRFADHLLILQAELTSQQYEQELDEQLDLVMALFDMRQTPVTKAVRQLYVNAKSALRDFGKEIRRFVANRLRLLGGNTEGATRDKFLFAANLLEGMYLSEAAQWAKAGEYRYIAFAIEQMLAKELEYESQPIADRPFRLPHHSLLRKDKEDRDLLVTTIVPMQLRYKLACLLAVDVVARLIEWRFGGPTPDRKDALEILARKARHPSIQLGEIASVSDGKKRLDELGEIITDISAPTWETVVCNRDLMDRFLEVIP